MNYEFIPYIVMLYLLIRIGILYDVRLTIDGDKMGGMSERTGGDLQKATVEFVKRQN